MHAGSAQRLSLRKDETPAKRERALCNQERLEALQRCGEVRLLEEATRIVDPFRDDKIPAARQVLADGTEQRVFLCRDQMLRLVSQQRLSLIAFERAVKRIEKLGQQR